MPGENEQQTTVVETPAADTTNTETQPSLDTGSALAEISSELFGQSDDGEAGGEKAEGAEAKAPGEPSSDEAAAPPQSEEKVETPTVEAPGTWTKEAAEKFAALDPIVQQEILKREEDMFKGIEEYKARAETGDQYEKVIEPYKPAMEKFNVNPVEMFGNFASNHYVLSFGTDQQKLSLAANLLDNYGIDLIQLAEHIGSRPAVDPQVAALRQELDQLKGNIEKQNNTATAETRANVQKAIDAFAADPKNIYFREVANDIVALMNAGAASSLQEAYDKAVYANPTTRAKEIDRLTAEKLAAAAETEEQRQAKIAASTAADVKTRESARNGTVPVGSMDDTLNETLARLRAN